MRRHVVGYARVDKSYIFWFGGAGRIRGNHRVRFVPHHKHLAMIVVVGVGGVIYELSACEGQLSLLLATLYLVVVKHATISALGGVVLSARSGMTAPST